MAMNKWKVLVTVILVTLPSLGHSRKELGTPGRNTRKNKPIVTQIVEVTTEVMMNETTSDFDVTEPTKNNSDSTSIPGNPSEVGDQVAVEEDSVTTALTTLQNQATEPTIFSWLYGRIMYAIESYSRSDSLWSWITGLGGGDAISTMALAESRLYDLKFSPLAYEIVEFLEPYGFKPYPDPYEPLYLDKDDIWKFAINWLTCFGILSTMWRSYDLPLPFGLYEKFGIILAPPGFDPDAADDDKHKEEEEEEKEEEEDDPYGDDDEEEDEEEEEEDDPYGDDDEEEEEEEDDPYGDNDEEEEEEDDEEDNYYKVGEEEEEREHESFAVFRQKDPDDEDDEDDDRYNDENDEDDNRYNDEDDEDDDRNNDEDDEDDERYNDDEDEMEMDDGEMDMGSEEGVSSYTFYNVPGDEDTEENGMAGDDDDLNGDSNDNEEEQEEESSYTSYTTSNANRRIDHTRGSPQTKRVRKPSQKASGTSHRPKTASKTSKRRVQKLRSGPTSRPPARPAQDSNQLRGSSLQRPPPGVAALRKVAGNRPPRRPQPTRPGNALRRLGQRRPPPPPPPSSLSFYDLFPFGLFKDG